MSRNRTSITDEAGLTPRTVTRRDALRLLVGTGLFAMTIPTVTMATTTQEKLDAAQLSYDQAQEQLDAIAAEYATLANQLAETQGKVTDVSAQIAQTQADIESKQAEIDQKQVEVEAKQARLGERMSSAYKSGAQSALDLILSATTFEELTSSIYYLDKVNEADNAVITEVKTLKSELESQKSELESKKNELESQKSELESLQATQQQQVAAAQAKQVESQELVNNLSSEVKSLIEQRDAELLAAQQEAERIAAEKAAAEAAAAAARNNSSNNGGSSYSGGSSSGGSSSGNNSGTSVVGSGSLAALQSASYQVASTGSGFCAAWVSRVFSAAGIGSFSGNACDMYWNYCGLSFDNIEPGMIVATASAPYGSAAATYGHVGIYIGNGTVRECRSGVVMSSDLSSWQAMYSKTVPARCGWLGGIALS